MSRVTKYFFELTNCYFVQKHYIFQYYLEFIKLFIPEKIVKATLC